MWLLVGVVVLLVVVVVEKLFLSIIRIRLQA